MSSTTQCQDAFVLSRDFLMEPPIGPTVFHAARFALEVISEEGELGVNRSNPLLHCGLGLGA